tara:strand:- start:668 stop:1825 length:1158 start_codon:yes stop_codon:yes gene_type:complete
MNSAKRELDLFFLVKLFLKNKFKLIFIPIIISLTFFSYSYYFNYLPFKNNTIFEKTYYVKDVDSNYEFLLINESLSKLNNVFNYASLKLNYYITNLFLNTSINPFDTIDNNSEQILPLIEEKQKYINNKFIRTILVTYLNQIDKNFSFSIIDNNSLKDILLLKIIFSSNKDKINYENIEARFNKIQKGLNKRMFDEIDKIIDNSLENYEMNKDFILSTIETFNISLGSSYKNHLKRQISNLSEDLQIASEVGLNYPIEFEYSKSIVNDDFSKGKIYITKKIEQLREKLDQPIEISEFVNNNFYYDLVNSDYYKAQSLNDLNNSYFDKKENFKFVDKYSNLKVSMDSASNLQFIILTSILLLILSFVLIFIFTILLYLYKTYDEKD